MSPIIWLVGLAVLFAIFDEWQRLHRRVRNLEERIAHLERGERGTSAWPPS